jgi:uncharacterized small protein (DUF1192 family)
MTAVQSWEQVLAAVEDDVARTEAQLEAERAAVPAPVADPASWRLPEGPELPALDAMPAVPAELADRIRDLRDRITGLQAELAGELATLRAARPARPARPAPRITGFAAPSPAHFVDYRM